MFFVEYLHKLEQELTKSIAADMRQLGKYPAGRLRCYRNGTRYNWYVVENGESKPIYKKDAELAEELARKGVLLETIEINKRRLKAVKLCLKYYDTSIPGERFRSKSPEYRRLATAHINRHGYTADEWAWMMEERPVQQRHPEDLNVPCELGYDVRSKSEADMVSALVRHHIVFRYEWPIKTDQYPYYCFPDFTVRHPLTDETIIIEHFGLMDRDRYIRDNANKLRDYFLLGYYPGKNLFFTYETLADKFTSYDAERFVKALFEEIK